MMPTIDLAELATLEKPRVLEIVNDLKINPLVKSIVLGQLRKLDPAEIKTLMGKVDGMVRTIQTGDIAAIDALGVEMKKYAAGAKIPPQYIDSLIDLVRKNPK